MVLGLFSALVWGAADFGGGWTSRKTAVFGVVLVSQLAGLALAVLIAILRREAFPGPADLGWSVLAGILGGIGITALYRALAIGTMSIVAPIIGVLAAIIPVIGGIVLEGWPPTLVLVGILVAIVAVILVSRVADEGGGRAGLTEALVAGVSIGLFGIVIAQISDGFVFGPMSVVRVTQAALVAVLILVTRSAWRPGRRFLPILIVIGILDMAGNVAYLLAVQTGLLAVASVLSALYPVVTVLLAAVVLRERITRDHAIGIVLAGLAIVCIGRRVRVDSATMSDLPADISIEPVWLVEATYAPDAAETRVPFRAEHVQRAAERLASGTYVEVGAFADVSGSVLIVRADSEEAALALVRDDVYLQNGVWVELRARPFGRITTTG